MGRVAAWVALAVACAVSAGLAEIVPLYETPVTVIGAVGEDTPRVKLRVDDPARVIRQPTPPEIDSEGWLVLDLQEGAAAQDPPSERTEHAVLLAALARGYGLPARVMTGMLLTIATVEGEVRVQAWGHAWTEVFDGAAWRIADAAQVVPADDTSDLAPDGSEEVEPPRLVYVPLAILDNEGPGYAIHLIAAFKAHPHSVAVEWPEAPDA